MSELTPVVGAQHGAFYLAEPQDNQTVLALTSTTRTRSANSSRTDSAWEKASSASALERKPIIVTDVPEDYVETTSGLGKPRLATSPSTRSSSRIK